ncbi:autophagy-related protein 22-like protein [Amylocarpus encephaloides]|uniref:Autophagy-related protein n=1 Tax=Amylocarpus encephaloides TaxID=45428 RepID=A0A9P7YIE8_9HELO|nr:autophagy-related protein 22-like protein [Amylocarpus encephaloides]
MTPHANNSDGESANSDSKIANEDGKQGVVGAEELRDANIDDRKTAAIASLDSNRSLIGWLVLCYSTGPTSSVAFTYVTASIQSVANLLGHVPGSTKPCARRGAIKCVVKFGAGEIDYLSYILYVRAIGRALEGILTIFVSGIADYSYYRKNLMMGSIFLFGAMALPFAGLDGKTYSYLTGLTTLYIALTTIQGVYNVMESSYIPIFMRSVGWHRSRRMESPSEAPVLTEGEISKKSLVKGARVSVLGLVASNVGALTALLIGIIITYTRGSYVKAGYHNFLLAITVAGCLTIVFASLGAWLLPNVPGKKRPSGTNLAVLPFQTWVRLLRSAPRYPEAFKLCIGWILWNTGWSNTLSVINLLFREISGLTSGDKIYTVYQFTNVICACVGSLSWMFLFPKFNLPIKRWAYIFLGVNIACVFWGTIGISENVTIGYKHNAEFWVEQVLFMSTSSALRSLNRTMYASMLPRGGEAQFFGLELTLDLAVGWINPLVQGVIQNRTHNLRYPMLPNLFLMLIALGLYISVDVEKGRKEAEVEME